MRLALLVVLLLALPARAAEPGYELRGGGAISLAEGVPGAVSFTLAPTAGRTIDTRAPLSLRLSAEDGLDIGKRRRSLADAADPRAEAPRFELSVTGKTAGSYTLSVEIRFWLCGRKTCRPVRDRLALPVTITSSPR